MSSTLRVFALVSAAALGACGDNHAAPVDGAGPGSGSSADASAVPVHIGGTITGLTAAGLVLANNGGDALTVAANAPTFTFATPIDSGTGYRVTVATQPAGELCKVGAGTGVATADVTSVTVACTALSFAAKQWTWMGGSNVATDFGVPGAYGTLGVADATNLPGGREQPASWRDAAGDLWMFGGYGVDSTGAGGQLNDLWKYEPTAGEWTWVAGTNVAPASTSGGAGGSAGVYGTLGTAAATNTPGGREQTTAWVDASGAVWMFGGEGIDVNGVTGELNDLWKFADGKWTWMGGSNAVGSGLVFPGPSGVYGTKGTAAPTNVPGGRYGTVSWIDHDGNFWMFGGSGVDSTPFMGQLDYLNDLWKYTPGAGGTAGQWTWIAGDKTVATLGSGPAGTYGTLGTGATTNYPGGRDAATSWVDASGNLWMFGGIGIDATGQFGFENDLWKFEPASGKWTWVGGSKTVDGNGHAGVYGTLGTAAATNVPGGRFSAASWIDGAGNLWLLGGQGLDATGNIVVLNDLWKFDPTAKKWTWMGGTSDATATNGGAGGVYGTLGTAASTNVPGARFGAASWTDADGKLWMFGGMGYDSADNQGHLNDFWVYRP